MKKTLIALFVLTGVATATTPLTLLPDLSNAELLSREGLTNDVYEAWNVNIGGKDGAVTSEVMTNNLTHAIGTPMQETGWYWAAANINKPDNPNGDDFSFTTDGFKFIGRQAYDGEFVVATCKLSDYISQDNIVLTSLSISFKAAGQSDIGFSAWVWDGTSASALVEETKTLHVGNEVSNVFDLNNLSLGSDDTILFVWNESSGGQTNTISSLTSSYTTATIPEPTTATLSLLALAGLAARRRRK